VSKKRNEDLVLDRLSGPKRLREGYDGNTRFKDGRKAGKKISRSVRRGSPAATGKPPISLKLAGGVEVAEARGRNRVGGQKPKSGHSPILQTREKKV